MPADPSTGAPPSLRKSRALLRRSQSHVAPICTRRGGAVILSQLDFNTPPHTHHHRLFSHPIPAALSDRPASLLGMGASTWSGIEAQAQQTQPRRRCRRWASPPFEYLAGRRSASSDGRRCPGQAGTSGAEVGRGHVLVVEAAVGRLPHAKPPVGPRESQQAPLVGRKGTGASCHVDGALEGRRLLPLARRSAFSSPSSCCCHRGHVARCRPGPLCSQQGRRAATWSAFPPRACALATSDALHTSSSRFKGLRVDVRRLFL